MPLPPNQYRQGGYCHPTGRWSVALYARGATNYSGARFAPRACTRDPPVPTHVDHTFPGQPAAFTISPLHQLTPHHLTTSPPHHLPTSPPPHHTISPPHHLPTSPSPHHLPTSPSPHLTTSPPHHLTTSPPHNLTRAAFPARWARPSHAPRPNSSTPPRCTGDRNGPLTWFWPDFGAARWRPGCTVRPG